MITHEQWMERVSRCADGLASAEEVRELEAALRADPALRMRFLQYMTIDAALASAPAAGASTVELLALPNRSRRMSRRPAVWWAAVAAVVMVGALLWRPWDQRPGPQTPGARSSGERADALVLLIAADHARWADPDLELSLRSGEMPAGLLRLESGVAEFRFPGGAVAVVQGPAAMRFSGPDQMFLQEGKVLCRCPTPQSRVTVTTPATQVVDLGTEFAVEAAASGKSTRVAVVTGEVQVGAPRGQVLRTGESAEVGLDRVVRMAPLPPETFAELIKAHRIPAVRDLGPNVLGDPVFATWGEKSPWHRTEGHVNPAAGVPTAVAVHARGHRFWPGVRQIVATGDVSGRLVVGSVEAWTPADDPLRERQFAILKLAFIDERGQEFATSFRYFLHAGSAPGVQTGTQVAAFAPPGTVKVELQLLLNARGQSGGTACFGNPRLVVASIEPRPRPQAPHDPGAR